VCVCVCVGNAMRWGKESETGFWLVRASIVSTLFSQLIYRLEFNRQALTGLAWWKYTSCPLWSLARKHSSHCTHVGSVWHVRQFQHSSPLLNVFPHTPRLFPPARRSSRERSTGSTGVLLPGTAHSRWCPHSARRSRGPSRNTGFVVWAVARNGGWLEWIGVVCVCVCVCEWDGFWEACWRGRGKGDHMEATQWINP
jgi:hypothetical protein